MDDSTTYVPLKESLAMCGAALCASGRAGHSVLPIQERVASASPGAWRDGIVVASANGHITFAPFDGELETVWNHDDLDLTAGEPLAWHPVAGLIAAGGQYRSALRR
jgi:hypothetical protein